VLQEQKVFGGRNRSSAKAIKNGILRAADNAKTDLPSLLRQVKEESDKQIVALKK
jgi:hypothetical protein